MHKFITNIFQECLDIFGGDILSINTEKDREKGARFKVFILGLLAIAIISSVSAASISFNESVEIEDYIVKQNDSEINYDIHHYIYNVTKDADPFWEDLLEIIGVGVDEKVVLWYMNISIENIESKEVFHELLTLPVDYWEHEETGVLVISEDYYEEVNDSMLSVPDGEEIEFYGWKYSNLSGVIIKSKKDVSCDWRVNEGLKDCEAYFEIYNLMPDNYDLDLEGLEKYSVSYEISSEFDLYNETKGFENNKKKINRKEWKNYKNNADNKLKSKDIGELISLNAKWTMPKYDSEQFNLSISNGKSTFKLDPDVDACGTLSSANSVYTLNQSISADATCITIGAENVTLDCAGYTITYGNVSAGYGIDNIQGDYDYLTVKNCNITKGNRSIGSDAGHDFNYGIYTQFANDLTIYNNTISTYGSDQNYPLYIHYTSTNTNITGNTLYADGWGNNQYGIYINQPDVVTIHNNTIYTNNSKAGMDKSYGILLYTADNVTITDNVIKTDGVDDNNWGIVCSNSDYAVVENNDVYADGDSGNQASMFEACEYPVVQHNSFVGNGTGGLNYGIGTDGETLYGIFYNNTLISDTTVSTSDFNIGISSTDNAYNNFTANTITTVGDDSNWGVRILRSDHNIYQDNVITTADCAGCTANHAVHFQDATPTNNTFNGNTFTPGSGGGVDINFASAAIPGSKLIDQRVNTYFIHASGIELYIENSTYGSIDFLTQPTGDTGNLSDIIYFGNNSVTIDTATESGFNVSANITLYGIDGFGFSNPIILRDGVECNASTSPSCYNHTALNLATVIFNVSSWSNYSIGEGAASDNEYPIFSNYDSSVNNTEYVENGEYIFNVTITHTNGTAFLEINGVNYTASNTSDVFNVTVADLPAGDHNYYWGSYGNGTSDNYNTSTTQSFTVAVNSSLVLSQSGTSPITYGTAGDFEGTGCPSQLTCTLYRDGVGVSSPDTTVLAAGTYDYVYNTTGNANYSATNTSTQTLTVNQAAGEVYNYINGTRANFTSNNNSATGYDNVYINGTLNAGSGNVELYVNGTLYNNGTAPVFNLTNLSAGYYNITAKYLGNTNYTADDEVWWVNITLTEPVVDSTPPYFTTIPADANINYLQGFGVDFDATDETAFDSYAINWTTNFQINSSGYLENSTANIGVGTYKINVTINDTSNNLNSTIYTVTVNAIASEVNTTLNNTEGNITINEGSSIDLNCSQITGDSGATIKLYNNGTLINSGASPLGNTTAFSTPGEYNITCIYEATNNYTQSGEEYYVTVNDITNPYFTGIPENITLEYISDTLNIQFNATDNAAIDTFITDDLINFTINSSGTLKNATALVVGTYVLNITINDTSNNLNSTLYQVDVEDTTAPTFDNLANKSHTVNTSFSFDLDATDASSLGSFALNDTSYFTINTTSGEITNSTNLSRIEIHNLNVSLNDTYNNLVSGIFFINITSAPAAPPSGGGGGIVVIDEDENITLSRLDIDYRDEWVNGVYYTVQVSPLDVNDSIVAVDNVSMEILNDIDYINNKVTVDIFGKYKQKFKIVNYSELDKKIRIQVNASQGSKVISNVIEVSIVEADLLTASTESLQGFFSDIIGFFSGNLIGICVCFMSMVFVMFAYVLIFKNYKGK